MTAISASLPRTELQLRKSKETAQKINASGKNRHVGSKNHQSKRVQNLVTGAIYESIREAAVNNSFNYSTLKSKLNGSAVNDTHLAIINP